MAKRLLLVAALAVCVLVTTAPALETPTFNDEVVRILQTRCQTCHRPGEHAPFPLLTYRDAYMHLLGREMKETATLADGTVRPLIHIDDWDFHWQGNYTFAQPVPLPSGTRIDMLAVFDNSAKNPRQPARPPRPVSWGDGTTDEMAIVFIGVMVDEERVGWRPR